MITIYLAVRRMVLFMANPLFYVLVAVLAGGALLISGRGGIMTEAVLMAWSVLKDISSFLFFAGTGPAQKDAHLILTVCMPSLIALAWFWMEKITGLQSMLKRKRLIAQ